MDTLTALPGTRAKRLIIDYLSENCEDLEICEKILRCFNAPDSPNDFFIKAIDEILERVPLHPLKDGFILLREKFTLNRNTSALFGGTTKGVDIQAIDRELSRNISGYEEFNESVKTALRSAELPYQHRELFDEFVDKASSIVEYCKGVDLLLEQSLGKDLLFPKLERSLQEFQNTLHFVSLNEYNPSPEQVLQQLELGGHFSHQSLPLHKMTLVAQTILNGKIVYQQFKTLDGLRAWAVILLLFCRSFQGRKAIIPLKGATDEQLVGLCKRLMELQDIRNPFAHRQTALKFLELDQIRKQVFSVLTLIHKLH